MMIKGHFVFVDHFNHDKPLKKRVESERNHTNSENNTSVIKLYKPTKNFLLVHVTFFTWLT